MPKQGMKRYDHAPKSSIGITDAEKPVPDIYPVIDTDLARDNLENDIPDADRQDL